MEDSEALLHKIKYFVNKNIIYYQLSNYWLLNSVFFVRILVFIVVSEFEIKIGGQLQKLILILCVEYDIFLKGHKFVYISIGKLFNI